MRIRRYLVVLTRCRDGVDSVECEAVPAPQQRAEGPWLFDINRHREKRTQLGYVTRIDYDLDTHTRVDSCAEFAVCMFSLYVACWREEGVRVEVRHEDTQSWDIIQFTTCPLSLCQTYVVINLDLFAVVCIWFDLLGLHSSLRLDHNSSNESYAYVC